MHQPLAKTLRSQLEKAVIKARDIAEQAAQEELIRLSVSEKTPASYLKPEQKELRNRLRAHGRALGDFRKPTGEQEITHLVSEVAYEHWHRMLFARFLSENNLLMYSDGVTPLSIQECFDLAEEETGDSAKGWNYAGNFATKMLPQVFRNDSPLFQLNLAPNYQKELEKLLASLPVETFQVSDSLGWVYQFWQARKKDEVNKAGNKIGANELPSVTQLFTEDYMVDFLLDNTLGAWYAGKVLAENPKLAISAKNEAEIREALALQNCPWSYLRFIKSEAGKWAPAAGSFEGWPKTAKELKCLDPCMGSGHFVVAMFERLVALRVAEENLSEAKAVTAVIENNLFGLEIDPRCAQIGAFNLALAAWRKVGHCPLPAMNLACSGLAPNVKKDDWLQLAGDNDRLQRGMAQLYNLFKDAPILGSLINPRATGGDLLNAAFHELQPLLEKALAQESKDDTAHEMAVTARGLAKAAEILAGQFTLVATNVPYLGRGKQDDELKDFCESAYPEGKADLATSFAQRNLDFCCAGGSTCLVMPQNWLFLGTYKKLRNVLLEDFKWDCVVRLGEHGFDSAQAAGAFVVLIGLSRSVATAKHKFLGLEAAEESRPETKAVALREKQIALLYQHEQLNNPEQKIILSKGNSTESYLEEFAFVSEGLHTGDYPRFGRNYWELPKVANGWSFQEAAADTYCFCGGKECILFWEDGKGELIRFVQERLDNEVVTSWIKGEEVWGQIGIAVSAMRELRHTLYVGSVFTHGAFVIVPRQKNHLAAIWSYCESGKFTEEVRRLDQKVCVARKSIAFIPFDLAHWQQVAAEKYPQGLPKPFSSDPTQWLFNGHPAGADQPLHVAVARLLGYQWPRQTGSSFPDCPALKPDGLEKLADDDGIVCLPAVRAEEPAHERLEKLLHAAYGKEWSTQTRNKLLKEVECDHQNLEYWLREKFFEQHSKLFHHRPFIWHVWDGLKDGFSALVNYHKLNKKNLERLIYTYLDDWIRTQKHADAQGVDGADVRLQAAENLKEYLEQILEGEEPYDIFVRWRPLNEQAMGWQPDINDGVRMNIRPFMSVEDVGKKDAGILKAKPNIKWDKDRGKDVESAPWYKKFKGDRINDHHLSLAEKQAAQNANKNKGNA